MIPTSFNQFLFGEQISMLMDLNSFAKDYKAINPFAIKKEFLRFIKAFQLKCDEFTFAIMKTNAKMPEIKYIGANAYWPNAYVARVGTFLFFYVYVCNKSDVCLHKMLYSIVKANIPREVVQEFKKIKNADELDSFLKKYNEQYRAIFS